MSKTNFDECFKSLAFDFFYKFSRFEFALKEEQDFRKANDKNLTHYAWNAFINKHKNAYEISETGKFLLDKKPKKQICDENGNLNWETQSFEKMDLEAVVRNIKTVRNNLFHGGKHDRGLWSDTDRNRELIIASTKILDQLSSLLELKDDYIGEY